MSDHNGRGADHIYRTILDDRRLEDELAEARRILQHFQMKLTSGNGEPIKTRLIDAQDVDCRDLYAFFERWPVSRTPCDHKWHDGGLAECLRDMCMWCHGIRFKGDIDVVYVPESSA